jgi:uncharacterized protein YjiS (DUF1127 family)
MWTPTPDSLELSLLGRGPGEDPEDPYYYIAQARALRAQAFADIFRRLATGVRWLTRRFVVAPVVGWHRRNVLRGELQTMDDRMLADIGISRAEIPRIVHQAYRTVAGSVEVPTGATLHRLEPAYDAPPKDDAETPLAA